MIFVQCPSCNTLSQTPCFNGLSGCPACGASLYGATYLWQETPGGDMPPLVMLNGGLDGPGVLSGEAVADVSLEGER